VAIRAAKLAKEKAEKAAMALDEADQVTLLEDFAAAAAATDSEAAVAKLLKEQDAEVGKAIQKVKEAARDKSLDAAAKRRLKAEAELAQKKYLALKTEVKKEDDKRAAALEMAKEEEQARTD